MAALLYGIFLPGTLYTPSVWRHQRSWAIVNCRQLLSSQERHILRHKSQVPNEQWDHECMDSWCCKHQNHWIPVDVAWRVLYALQEGCKYFKESMRPECTNRAEKFHFNSCAHFWSRIRIEFQIRSIQLYGRIGVRDVQEWWGVVMEWVGR